MNQLRLEAGQGKKNCFQHELLAQSSRQSSWDEESHCFKT